MRPLFALLFVLAALPVAAEDTPAPAVPTASAPAPVPAAPNGQAVPTPVARKEDEPASILDRVRGMANALTNAHGISGRLADLTAQVNALTATIAERDATIATLRATIAEQSGVLTQLDTFLTQHGTPGGTPAAVANPAAALEAAVSTQVANTVRQIGVPVAAIGTTSAAQSGPATMEDVEAQLAAAKTPAERQKILTEQRALILRSN